MDSETQPSDDLPNLEAEYYNPPAFADPVCKNYKWKVEVIDIDGNIESRMMSYQEVWKLQNCRVIAHFNEDNQPIGDSGGLLATWLGQLSNDANLLPVNYGDWRNVNPHIKLRAWELIQSKFRFDDAAMRKKYVMSALGSRCRDAKRRLWRKCKGSTRSETVQNRPDNVPEEQWNHLAHMRFTEKWRKTQERNEKSQLENKMPHGCGRKSFARKKNEIKIKTGRTPCRAELFIETRKKPDGSFTSEEAKTRADALTVLLNRNPRVTSNVTASLDDEYAQVFGPEPRGRVRCVGRGPTPSKLARLSNPNQSDIENSELVAQLKAQLTRSNDEKTALTTFLTQIIGSSSGEQARIWATAYANIPSPAFANMPNVTNPLAFANMVNLSSTAALANMTNLASPPAFANTDLTSPLAFPSIPNLPNPRGMSDHPSG